MTAILNPGVRRDDEFRGLFGDEDYRDVHDYFAVHPELPPTPLRRAPTLATTFGVAAVDLKDESQRFGVNAFKILGVRYAVHRLGDEAARRGLVCATAGNHGRAVARVARQKHVPCTVFVPAARTSAPAEHRTRATRIGAMREDDADVIEVDGSYEEAVRRAAAHGRETGATVISDTSWEGYGEVPRWIMAGYTQLFEEAGSQWDSRPSIVLVQAGVGGLLCAAASWFAWRFGANRPFLIGCEPESAACVLESVRAGHPVTIGSSLDTIMAGLRCAAPSPAAWPAIAAGVDAFISITDADVLQAMETLASLPDSDRIEAGPSGACGVAALAALATRDDCAPIRKAAGFDTPARALTVITEGA